MARRTRITWVAAALATLPACQSGCAGDRVQSALHPAGPAAQQVAILWWVMLGVYGTIFVLTLVLLAIGLAAPRHDKPRLGPRFVFATGIVLPTLILAVMLVHTVQVTRALQRGEPEFRVQVIGHRWWWEVRYPDHDVVDANEIHIPAGRRVELEVRSADVVHSLWIPNLAGKMDLLPEHVNRLQLQADRPGVFRGQCAEFCGTQHALMALQVVVHEPRQMQRWLEQRRRSDPAQEDPTREEAIVRGRGVFMASGCADCHRIHGLSTGRTGPDLTHIGSRLTLAAGVFENTDQRLGDWITDPQSMKPGILMPPTRLAADDHQALVRYLRSLE